MPDWMLTMKGANNKRWKELEKKPIKRRTISTDIKRNTNKRFKKIIIKDAKRLSKMASKYPQGEEEEMEGGQEENEERELVSGIGRGG